MENSLPDVDRSLFCHSDHLHHIRVSRYPAVEYLLGNGQGEQGRQEGNRKPGCERGLINTDNLEKGINVKAETALYEQRTNFTVDDAGAARMRFVSILSPDPFPPDLMISATSSLYAGTCHRGWDGSTGKGRAGQV